MRYLKIVLIAILLSADTARSDESPLLRYQGGFGPMTLTLHQEMTVREPVASREMTFDVEIGGDFSAADASLMVGSAKATYSAHGMQQHLSTRHLTGRTIPLGVLEGGLELTEADPQSSPLIDLGPPILGGFSVSEMLLGVLPRLPVEPVSEGSSWETARTLRFIEGWAWGSGRVSSRHKVLSIDERHGKTLIKVATQAEGTLESSEGERAYRGELKRTVHWTFDATDGRVISISMQQETQGETTLPQGDLPLHQKTHVELAPAA